ncbi:MAG: hypothetical protein M1118_04610 [Chloroflexi bacterium]|nr:hypothetical protein [Chloroflexota bacterium]
MVGNHHRRGTVARADRTVPSKAGERASSTQLPVSAPDDDTVEPVAFKKMTLTPEESAVFQHWYKKATPHPIEPGAVPLEHTDPGY